MTPEQECLVDLLPQCDWPTNGIPTPEQGRARVRAVDLVAQTCAGVLQHAGLRCSPLGPEWGHDIDVHVRQLPSPVLLRELGWLPLDPLLARLGSPAGYRWAVVHNSQVLAMVDFHLTTPPDPLTSVLLRCAERGEVRLREVLELRALRSQGRDLPSTPAVLAAARAERAFGGDHLRPWQSGSPSAPPVRIHSRRWREPVRRLRQAMRPRLVVAVSGVDGAGKSTLVRNLETKLRAAAVPVSVVWARPGMSVGRRLYGFAARVKKLLGQEAVPGVRAVARGAGSGLLSRRGLVGWAWVMTLTAAYLLDVRLQHARARGVVLYDRHLYDALATLEFAYEDVDLRLPRAMLFRLLPKSDLTLYLDVSTELAVSRKPGDPFGEHAVDTQLRSYSRWRDQFPELLPLDASLPPERLAELAFAALLDPTAHRRAEPGLPERSA